MSQINYYENTNSIQYFIDKPNLDISQQRSILGKYICKINRNDPLSYKIKRLAGIIPRNSIICRDTENVYQIIE